MPEVRRAGPGDLEVLVAIEEAAFEPYRRSSRRSLRRSLRSPRQSVWLVGDEASLVLWHHRDTMRVYGIAVRPGYQGRGLGRLLMRHAETLARRQGMRWVVLEADCTNAGLLAWYDGLGYQRTRRCVDHYGPGRDAWRFVKRVA